MSDYFVKATRGNGKRITGVQECQMKDLFDRGLPKYKIALKLGCTYPTVLKYLRRKNEDRKQVRRLWNDGGLTHIRRFHKLTQREAAAKIGVDRRTWQHWEEGKYAPSYDSCVALTRAFGGYALEPLKKDIEKYGTINDTPERQHALCN